MEINSQFSKSLLLLLLAGFKYSTLARKPDDTETIWKGNQRIIAIEDVYPLRQKGLIQWRRGWGCGWTKYGLCFSPDYRKDIHNNYIIPFKHLIMYVYSDQPADPNAYGLGSLVMTRFSKRKDMLMEARVYGYSKGYNWRTRKFVTYSLSVRTEYKMFGKNQLKQSFPPSKVRLKGAHNACRYFKTNCMANERCVPRRLSGHICPGEYKCVCKSKAWKAVRGRGCVDVDECEKSPCGALFVCVNTIGSYKCECQAGYKGSKCDEEIDECKQSLCPKNSVCKNVPGSFQCTCLPGFTGKDCAKSETEDSETTAPTIKEYTNKKIAIPRKRPVKTIRKPVFLYEPRHTERAVMIAAIAVLNSLGIFLFCFQKRKRKKTLKEGQETRQSGNQILEKEETIQSNQVSEKAEEPILNDEELNLSKTNDQQLTNTNLEMILNNQKLKTSSETSADKLEVEENRAIASVQELQNSETIPDDQKLNENVFPSDQELPTSESIPDHQKLDENAKVVSGDKELKLSETVPNSQELENIEAMPCDQVLEYSETIPDYKESQNSENQELLDNAGTVPSKQEFDTTKSIRPSGEALEKTETIPYNCVLENSDVLPSNQNLLNTETVQSPNSQELEKEEIADGRELLADESDVSFSLC